MEKSASVFGRILGSNAFKRLTQAGRALLHRQGGQFQADAP
jgi:hypothetical protein